MNTQPPSDLVLRTGNQMIAEAAVAAGCRFFAGYPITPASGIYKGMIDLLQKQGDLAVSAPDEISALAYCVGASMRGTKAMTATSGPGWALMIETVQYALMTETPVVIALVQRLGPSTGGATQGGQGDVLLTEFCTSGGYTIPILTPSTAEESYRLTITAFNWSEMLRTPVVLLTDKEVGMTSECVNRNALGGLHILDRVEAVANGEQSSHFHTYAFDAKEDVPVFAAVGGSHRVVATGSAHNKVGKLRKNDPETLEVLHHLEEKIRLQKNRLSVVDADVQIGARTLLISYGVTARAMREATRRLRARGMLISAVTVQSLFPVPDEALRRAAAGVRTVVVAEENLTGQYRSVITPLFPDADVVGVNKIGSMITPKEIEHAVA